MTSMNIQEIYKVICLKVAESECNGLEGSANFYG